MNIKIPEKEVELHIEVLEENINYWMFESNCFQEYSKEICSSILLLEKLVDKDYRFSGQTWISGNSLTIQELKKDYISTLKEYMPSNKSDNDYEDFKLALERAEKYLG